MIKSLDGASYLCYNAFVNKLYAEVLLHEILPRLSDFL